MRFACLSSIVILLPAAMASKGLLLPRGYFPHGYLDACDVNCTLTQREHILCTVDCPPIVGFQGSGSAYYAHPTGQVAPIANLSAPTATTTQYITTIPPYCLPGGPGAPVPNVPTVSIPEATLLPTTPAPSLDIAPAVSPAIESLIPAIILKPTGTVASLGQVFANQTSFHYESGAVPTPVEQVQQTSQIVAVQPLSTSSPEVPSPGTSNDAARREGVLGKVLASAVFVVMTGRMVGVF